MVTPGTTVSDGSAVRNTRGYTRHVSRWLQSAETQQTTMTADSRHPSRCYARTAVLAHSARPYAGAAPAVIAMCSCCLACHRRRSRAHWATAIIDMRTYHESPLRGINRPFGGAYTLSHHPVREGNGVRSSDLPPDGPALVRRPFNPICAYPCLSQTESLQPGKRPQAP
jgi:hypothetical protein